jgi:hypothetical protein
VVVEVFETIKVFPRISKEHVRMTENQQPFNLLNGFEEGTPVPSRVPYSFEGCKRDKCMSGIPTKEVKKRRPAYRRIPPEKL